MNDKLITYDEMKAALERAVAERGEGFVYEAPDPRLGCVYYDADFKPSCIVGLAMSYLRPHRRLQEGPAAVSLSGLADDKARCLADFVQQFQDGGEPWGLALSQGLNEVTT